MNPSTALARVLVDELVRGGVTEAVLSPGSRSAPLAFALSAADREGRIRLHVRIDERSAGFLALGLAKASGRPVPVVTTSGTATANLHPAVLEASHARTPLLVLTADRPPELRGTGANQTVDQVKLYGGAVRLFVEVGAPELGQDAYWRGLTCRALSAAAGDLSADPGPVHLNLAFREPLVPVDGDLAPGREDGGPWTSRESARPGTSVDDFPDRTVVVVGDTDVDTARSVALLAGARGWPVVAEPSSGVQGIDAVELLLGVPGWLERHLPDRVLVVGRHTLSRAVGRLVASAPSCVVATAGTWPDPAHRASRILASVPVVAARGSDPTWLPLWENAGEAAREAVEIVLGASGLSEPVVAAEVIAAAQDLLVVGSSKPVRDLFLAGAKPGVRVLANRGAAGIDGVVSTAIGAALAHQRETSRTPATQAFALLGDLTFLHDSNGLVIGPEESRPDLTFVVVNNDGGAIFGLLEQGRPEYAEAFERVFGTPHHADLESLCAATRTSYRRVGTREELAEALSETGGLRVVEVPTDRTDAVALDARLRDAVALAVG